MTVVVAAHLSEADLQRRFGDYGSDVELIRLALTVDDCDANLSSFPTETKRRDPRYRWYRDRYGHRGWVLDALVSQALRERVADAIDARLNHAAWEGAEVAERAERASLATIVAAWPCISGQATKNEGVSDDDKA